MQIINKSFLSLLLLTLQILHLNIPVFRGNIYFIEPLLFAANSLLSLIVVFRKPIELNRFEVFLFFGILYLIYRTNTTYNIDGVVKILFVTSFYFYAKIVFNGTDNKNIIYSLISLIAIFFLSFLIMNEGKLSALPYDFYIPNKSIFGILLASQLAFITPFILKDKSKAKFFFLIIFVCGGCLLFNSNSRSAWLGLFVSFTFGFIASIKLKVRRIKLLTISTFLFVILFSCLLLYKSPSTHGRLLIYKISLNIFKDNWFWGVGNGQFKVAYNLYQAKYFSNENINGSEALLADNSFYAFNEPLQLLVEAGVIGFLLFCIPGYFLIKNLWKNRNIIIANTVYFGAFLSMICIVIASLFSYPLHIYAILLFFIFCIAAVNQFTPDKIILNKRITMFGVKFFIMTFCIVSCAYFAGKVFYNIKKEDASIASRTGYKQKSLKKYSELEMWIIKDPEVNLQYARELYYMNNLEKAKEIIAKTKKIATTNDIYILSGDINNELNQRLQAEQDYLTALHMVPNRMTSRYKLMNFYLDNGDTTNGLFWAKSIINMPIKIPSNKTVFMKKQAEKLLVTEKSN